MAMIRDSDRPGNIDEPSSWHFDRRPLDVAAIDPARIWISFDRRSDTLLIQFFGRERDTISVPIARYLYVLVDPETEQVVGLHIEGFLAQAVKDVPDSIVLLDFADLRGITAAEVRLLRAQLSIQQPDLEQDHRTISQFVQQQRRDAIVSYIAAERTRFPLPFFIAA